MIISITPRANINMQWHLYIASGVIILTRAATLYQKAKPLFSAVVYQIDNHYMVVKFPVN